MVAHADLRVQAEGRQQAAGAEATGRTRKLVLALGPATVVAGLVWALLQPYRITLLHLREESFWSLAAQPPLLVVVVGVVFHLAVARGLASDLAEAER